MRVTFLIVLILLLVTPVTAQSLNKPFEDLEEEQFNFRITESADFTNYLDQSILVTVEANQEQSFSIKETGLNTSDGTWIWGINQTSVENRVQMGILYHSGFNASSLPDKYASVTPFNYTSTPIDTYNETISIEPLDIVKDNEFNISLINNFTTFTPFITLNQPFFVLSTSAYITALEVYLNDYISNIALPGSNSQIETSDTSLDLSLSGDIIDIHQFTYQQDEVSVIGDYNTIEFNGGFSINYDDNKVLNEYNAEYEIIYDDVTIMEYSYYIRVRSGSGGNIVVGDAGIAPNFQLPMVIFSLILIPIAVKLICNRREK